MPRFRYKAMTVSGKTSEGELNALNRNELILKLKELSLSPLEIIETGNAPNGNFSFPKKFFGSSRVSRKNITQFTAQLSALVHAKMNLAKALKALEQQSTNEALSAMIDSLLQDVQKGKSLSDALEGYPEHFSALYINMIRIGELGGVLDKSLQRIVEVRLKDEELVGKIKGALTYPCVMAAVMIMSVLVMLTFVIPKFSGVFSQMGTSLPFSTRVVISSSDFLKTWWWAVLILAAGAGGALTFMLRKEEYRLAFDKLKLHIPILGNIMKEICLSRFSLAMGSLLSSGVSMMKALDATVPVTGNFFIEKILKQISDEVREGGSLSEALRKRQTVFPSLMTGMAGTGEEAGNLDEMLSNAGEYFRKESEDKINTLTTLFEPVMIVVMGGIVGFIISAILLPIFNVSTSIH